MRQRYLGTHLDPLLERARNLAERDGRLRYVWGDRIHLRPSRDGKMVVMGAEDFALVRNGIWQHYTYN